MIPNLRFFPDSFPFTFALSSAVLSAGIAQAGYGRNEMYPCINDQTDYGLAVAGIMGSGDIPVSLAVDAVRKSSAFALACSASSLRKLLLGDGELS